REKAGEQRRRLSVVLVMRRDVIERGAEEHEDDQQRQRPAKLAEQRVHVERGGAQIAASIALRRRGAGHAGVHGSTPSAEKTSAAESTTPLFAVVTILRSACMSASGSPSIKIRSAIFPLAIDPLVASFFITFAGPSVAEKIASALLMPASV